MEQNLNIQKQSVELIPTNQSMEYLKFQILKVFRFYVDRSLKSHFNGRTCVVIHCDESVVLFFTSMANLRHVHQYHVFPIFNKTIKLKLELKS